MRDETLIELSDIANRAGPTKAFSGNVISTFIALSIVPLRNIIQRIETLDRGWRQ